MKLIVNADDFGYSKGVNYGILDAHRDGIVTSATMMANMPGFVHATGLAKQHPTLGVGIHLVLTCGTPLLPDVPSLVDEHGAFRKQSEIFQHATSEDIERELVAQFEKFMASGLKPTHLDSHHHVHAHEKVFPIVRRLAERHGLPLRRISINPDHEALCRGIKTTDAFFWDFYGEDLTTEVVERVLALKDKHKVVEMMCHPAYVDEALLAGSSYAMPRVTEVAILTDKQVKQMVADAQVKLITYKEIL